MEYHKRSIPYCALIFFSKAEEMDEYADNFDGILLIKKYSKVHVYHSQVVRQ